MYLSERAHSLSRPERRLISRPLPEKSEFFRVKLAELLLCEYFVNIFSMTNSENLNY